MKKIKLTYKYYFITALLVAFLGIIIFPRIPYLNLVSFYSMEFVVFFCICLLLKFKYRLLYIASVVLFILMAVLTTVGSSITAEYLGTSTFLILLVATIGALHELLKK